MLLKLRYALLRRRHAATPCYMMLPLLLMRACRHADYYAADTLLILLSVTYAATLLCCSALFRHAATFDIAAAITLLRHAFRCHATLPALAIFSILLTPLPHAVFAILLRVAMLDAAAAATYVAADIIMLLLLRLICRDYCLLLPPYFAAYELPLSHAAAMLRHAPLMLRC